MMKYVVYVWAYYALLCVHDNKQTYWSSSSWRGYRQGAVLSDHARYRTRRVKV